MGVRGLGQQPLSPRLAHGAIVRLMSLAIIPLRRTPKGILRTDAANAQEFRPFVVRGMGER